LSKKDSTFNKKSEDSNFNRKNNVTNPDPKVLSIKHTKISVPISPLKNTLKSVASSGSLSSFKIKYKSSKKFLLKLLKLKTSGSKNNTNFISKNLKKRKNKKPLKKFRKFNKKKCKESKKLNFKTKNFNPSKTPKPYIKRFKNTTSFLRSKKKKSKFKC
jgi:hypothetical protein